MTSSPDIQHDVATQVLYENQWKVQIGGKHTGPYATQKEAIYAAVDAARKTGKTNPDGALVRVQRADNFFRTKWTYSQDL